MSRGTLLDYVGQPDTGQRFAVIIPAYRPDERLLDLLAELSADSLPAIVLVDDGSGPEYAGIFRRAAEFPKVRLVRHAVNLGKGAALKSGFNEALCAFPDLLGVITADADGQHHPGDIARVAGTLAAQPDRLVLGIRAFSGDVPLRSRVGNGITRAVMRALVGQNIPDTQTGLRGIPAALLPHLLRLEANGYDFELDMLIAVRQRAMPIAQAPIRTIYEPGNRTSHFNPLTDSMKIYFVLLRFSSVSLMTAALDTLVFFLAYRRLGNVAWSQVLGRLAAVAFNYSMLRRAVFFSKLRHLSVLPKYLLLVCLSGIASYAGIELLNTRLHIQPLPAKLLVETLLFFANFAIQRDFIFGKIPPAEGGRRAPGWIVSLPAWVPSAVLAAATLALLGVVLYGFRAAHWLPDRGWTPAGQQRFLHYTWVFGAAAAALVLTAPAALPPVFAVLLLAATGAALGPAALLSAAGFLVASCALGSKLVGRRDDTSAETQLCATLVGIAVYIFLMTFLARLPVNYPAVYIVLMAIPVAADLRGVGRRLASWTRPLIPSRARRGRWSRPQAASLALLLFVLGMHWLIVPQPESSTDGLATHLAIPHNIALHHVMTYQPARVLWSVMPMGADWCYTMVYLPGGEYAARLLNFAMLLVVEALLYRAARRFVTPAVAFLILALFASTSLVQLVTGSLFVENFLAATVIGMLVAVWRFGDTGERRFLYAAAVLGGTALAIKLGGLAYLAVALPAAIVELRRQWRRLGARPALAAGIALLLLLAAALPAYAIAWRMTGNPVFPFLNRTFPSSLLDRNAVIDDPRFTQPLTPHTPFDLTFYTGRYYEGRPGSLGFQLLLLAPLGILGLLFVRRRPAVCAAVVSIAGAVIILRFLPNARYLYPSLPLLLVPFAALLGWLAPGAFRRLLIALAVLCVMLNAWYLPSSNYYHGDFYLRSPLSAGLRQDYIHRVAPIREIGDYMNRVHPGAPVLLADNSDVAAFDAEVYENGWHQYGVWTRLGSAQTPQEVAAILRGWNVQYVAAPKPRVGVVFHSQALRDLLSQCATPEFQTTWLYLARLEKGCDATLVERQPLLLSPGLYDDQDPAIAYRGGWVSDAGWPKAFSQTISFCNVPGADVRVAFQGDTLVYVYTRAANRGQAGVVIDGVRRATLDLYSPITAWQTSTVFSDLGSRRHLAVITVLPGKNPQSSDRFVDVDAFEVKQSHAGAVHSGKVLAFSGWLALCAAVVFVARGGPAAALHMSAAGFRRIAAYGAGLGLFAWFVFLVRGGLASWFDADDLMNLYYYWTRPWSGLLKANLFFWSSYYRPAGGVFYKSIHALWGFHPLPFRIASLALLCAGFVLLAVVVHQLTGSRWAALLALLLAGINPTFSSAYFDTGTVYDLLAYVFFWGAFAWYVRLRQAGRTPGAGGMALLLCLFAAALDSKEISVTLPVAVALYEIVWHPPAAWNFAALWPWIRREGRFAAIGAVCDAAYIVGKRYGPDSLFTMQTYRPRYSLRNYFDSLWHYTYGFFDAPVRPVPSWEVAGLLAAMAAIAVLSRRRCLIWGVGFVIVGVLPLAFIPARDGFAYLAPSVGWAVYAAGLADWLLQLLARKRPWWQAALQTLALILLFVELAPWQRESLEKQCKWAHERQERFLRDRDQIHALIPAPRKGARLLLLSDAGGFDDYDVYFLIRLFYGDPSLEADRMTVLQSRHLPVIPSRYDYMLDWTDGRFVLVK